MSNVGFRIFTKVNRPSKELMEQFHGLPSSNICDEMNRIGSVYEKIRPIGKTSLVGPAFTVKEQLGDIMMFHKAIALAQPGDVIVVDGQQGSLVNALAGELMVLWAKSKGLAGLVIDGAIRDSDAICKLDFPVYAAGVTSKGPYKQGPGEINVPISCGGVVVTPGDIVVGDADGIVIIPAKDAETVLAKAKNKYQNELKIRELISKGAWAPEPTDEELKARGCDIIDDYYK